LGANSVDGINAGVRMEKRPPMTDRDKLELINELNETLRAIDRASRQLTAMYQLEKESMYMVKPIERMRWTIKRLSRHAFSLACQIGPAS
jgi:hypothetical protein